jgi:DNA-binding transcriptional LysR family regulator
VLPSWIAAPYLEAGRVARVDLDAPTEVRTWYTATRQGDRTEALEALAATLEQQLTSIGPAALAA